MAFPLWQQQFRKKHGEDSYAKLRVYLERTFLNNCPSCRDPCCSTAKHNINVEEEDVAVLRQYLHVLDAFGDRVTDAKGQKNPSPEGPRPWFSRGIEIGEPALIRVYGDKYPVQLIYTPKIGDPCPLLDEKKMCKVHNNKPTSCHNYPVTYDASMDSLLINTTCPLWIDLAFEISKIVGKNVAMHTVEPLKV